MGEAGDGAVGVQERVGWLRRLVRRVTEATGKWVSGAVEGRPLAEKTLDGSRRAGQTSVRFTKSTVQKVGDGVDRTAAKLSLDEYRTVVDRALDQALDVIHAQQIELEVLRQRVDQIERRDRS